MTDLNTAIALSKGYKFGQPVSGMNRDIWYETFPDSGWFETKCPDYEHDARLYMALAVESGFSIIYHPYKKKYLAVKLVNELYVDEFCIDCDFENHVDDSLWQDDPGTAVCQAFCKLKGIEVVG
jgi:hypothetical protein